MRTKDSLSGNAGDNNSSWRGKISEIIREVPKIVLISALGANALTGCAAFGGVNDETKAQISANYLDADARFSEAEQDLSSAQGLWITAVDNVNRSMDSISEAIEIINDRTGHAFDITEVTTVGTTPEQQDAIEKEIVDALYAASGMKTTEGSSFEDIYADAASAMTTRELAKMASSFSEAFQAVVNNQQAVSQKPDDKEFTVSGKPTSQPEVDEYKKKDLGLSSQALDNGESERERATDLLGEAEDAEQTTAGNLIVVNDFKNGLQAIVDGENVGVYNAEKGDIKSLKYYKSPDGTLSLAPSDNAQGIMLLAMDYIGDYHGRLEVQPGSNILDNALSGIFDGGSHPLSLEIYDFSSLNAENYTFIRHAYEQQGAFAEELMSKGYTVSIIPITSYYGAYYGSEEYREQAEEKGLPNYNAFVAFKTQLVDNKLYAAIEKAWGLDRNGNLTEFEYADMWDASGMPPVNQ